VRGPLASHGAGLDVIEEALEARASCLQFEGRSLADAVPFHKEEDIIYRLTPRIFRGRSRQKCRNAAIILKTCCEDVGMMWFYVGSSLLLVWKSFYYVIRNYAINRKAAARVQKVKKSKVPWL
jgi:hypothetical protein